MGRAPRYTPEYLQKACDLFHEVKGNTAEVARRLKRARSTAQYVIAAFQRAGLTPRDVPAEPAPAALLSTVETLRSEVDRLSAALAEAIKPKFTIRHDLLGSGAKIRVCVIGDAHDDPTIPDKSRFEIAGRFVRDQKHDVLLSIGDFLNLNSLCFHIPNENYTGRAKPTFLEDIRSGREAYAAINSGLGSYEPERHKTLGNHCNRMFRVEDAAPASWGMYVAEFESMMRDAKFTYSPYGEFTFYGGVGFTHVPKSIMDKPMGGKNPEVTVGNDSVFDVVFGHTHVRKDHTARKIGQRRVRVVNAACYLPWGHVEDFAKHTPGGWDWGLTDITIQGGQIQSSKFIPLIELEERYGVAP